MQSPFEGRFTSEYDLQRVLTIHGVQVSSPHAGIDIAPPVPGTVGSPVHAAFAGVVERVVRGRQPGQAASVGVALAPGRSGNGVVISNPDGERQLYGHVAADAGWAAGDPVAEGDRLGITDLSGTITGPHLHLEMWRDGPGSHFDPAPVFAAHEITIGSAPTGVAALMEDDMPLTDDDLRKIGAAVWAHDFGATSINEIGIPSESAAVRLRSIRKHLVRQNRRAAETLVLSRMLTDTVADIAAQTAGLDRAKIEKRVKAAVKEALERFDEQNDVEDAAEIDGETNPTDT